MNCYNLQQNAFSSLEEMRSTVYQDSVICPKPRRVGILSNVPVWPLRFHLSQQAEGSDSKAGAELLDLILKKESYGDEHYGSHVASSPPYFCGSPPARSSNPVIQDARFGDEKIASISTISSPSGLSSPSSASRKGGCVRMKFGLKPAAVRVEGFDCLNRDRQNSSIPAVA